jgi:predicted membrane channel-forming protein YqfA (hemolysin III family)
MTDIIILTLKSGWAALVFLYLAAVVYLLGYIIYESYKMNKDEKRGK